MRRSFGGNRLVRGRRLAADYQDALNERAATIDRGGGAPARSSLASGKFAFE
jgi:hypothetical protein